jgi:molybdate transport system substrate-binding protein
MKSRLLALITVLALFVAACSSAVAPTATPPASPTASVAPALTAAPGGLLIYGAASLTGVLAQVKIAYAAAVPGVPLTVSTDSSTALETQIEQGAPADVFLSADTANPQKLVDKHLSSDVAVKFAGNLLIIIVPANNPAGIKSPPDLAKAGVKIIAAGDTVPIATYANQLVTNLAKDADYPSNFAASYAANVVSKEDNVKALVAKIELGEGDAGIVYVTDAKASTKVATVDVPPAANVPATYAGVVIKASPSAAAGTAFLTWLAGPAGQAILRSFGFLPPS